MAATARRKPGGHDGAWPSIHVYLPDGASDAIKEDADRVTTATGCFEK